jgi:hypothetical protein
MTRLWKRDDDVERMLKAARPEPPQDFFRAAKSLVESRSTPRRAPLRVGLAVGVTAVAAASLAAFGGVGYAASAATSTAHAVSAVFAPAHHPASPQQRLSPHGSKPSGSNSDVSSADAQYGQKATLCHNGHTISVGLPAVPAHHAIGDTDGPCPTP